MSPLGTSRLTQNYNQAFSHHSAQVGKPYTRNMYACLKYALCAPKGHLASLCVPSLRLHPQGDVEALGCQNTWRRALTGGTVRPVYCAVTVLTAGMSAQQMNLAQLGDIPPGAPEPMNVTGELDLTQAFGPLDNGTYLTRGYYMTPSGVPYFSNASQVRPDMSGLVLSLRNSSVTGLHRLANSYLRCKAGASLASQSQL